jgi:hypothetical protein
LLVPGITLFVVLLIGRIVVRSLPLLLFVGVFFYGFGLIPIAVILAIATGSFFYWRRHWLSGFSLIRAAPLVFAFGIFPGATELGINSLEAHHIFGPYYQRFHP